MMPLIVIALLIGLPAALIFLLRANGSLVLLALCAGSVLQRFVGNDASKLLDSYMSKNSGGTNTIAQLALLFVPALLTTLFLRKAVSSSKAKLNLLPAFGTGIIATLLAVPLLPGGLRHDLMQTSIWTSINQFQSAIVAGAITISLLLFWFTHPKPIKGKHGK